MSEHSGTVPDMDGSDGPVVFLGKKRGLRKLDWRATVAILIICIMGLWVAARAQQAGDDYQARCDSLNNELTVVQSRYQDAIDQYYLNLAQTEMNRAVDLTDRLDKAGCL